MYITESGDSPSRARDPCFVFVSQTYYIHKSHSCGVFICIYQQTCASARACRNTHKCQYIADAQHNNLARFVYDSKVYTNKLARLAAAKQNEIYQRGARDLENPRAWK